LCDECSTRMSVAMSREGTAIIQTIASTAGK
jgi:hypothetical protein